MEQVKQHPKGDSFVDKALPVMSIFTMVMTVPQVWSVWVESEVQGVSLLSWGAYTIAACLWLVHGLQRRDPSIWLSCIGWVVLDAAVVLGVIVRS